MSRYLIDRIKLLGNVDIRVKSEPAELHGERPGIRPHAVIRASPAASGLDSRRIGRDSTQESSESLFAIARTAIEACGFQKRP